MINILSTQVSAARPAGPAKRLRNLMLGLDRIGYPYVLNAPLDATARLWVHDDPLAVYYLHKTAARAVVGPNLYTLPDEIPSGARLERALYIQPCTWAQRRWELAGFDSCPMTLWPVGEDADRFAPVAGDDGSVLVYHKQRDPAELAALLELLRSAGLTYRLLIYGEYTEDEQRHALAQCAFAVWHSGFETQNHALLETLACDVPMVVWDCTRQSQARSPHRYAAELDDLPVTSAPYFDARCGLKVATLGEILPAIARLGELRASLGPRQYVLDNLPMDGQARAFVALWEHWGLSFDMGLRERPRRAGYWREPLAGKIARLTRREFRERHRRRSDEGPWWSGSR